MKLLQEMLAIVEGKQDLWSLLNQFAEEVHGEFGFSTISEDDMKSVLFLNKANKIARDEYGEYGFAALSERDMQHLVLHHPEVVKIKVLEKAVKDAIADQQLDEAGRTHSVPSGTMTGYVRPEHSDKNRLASRHRSFSSDNTPTGDGTFKRGAPRDRARAFDKVNPRTGARPDRSVLKTIGKFYSVSDSSNEGDYIQVLVLGGDVPEIDVGSKYHGVNVLFMADGSIDAVTADNTAYEQWKEDKEKIIAAARKAVGADKIAAFVKRGGDTEHRKSDDWDNGYNDSYSGPKMHKRADEAVAPDIIGYVDPASVKAMKDGNLGSVSIWPKKGKGKTMPVCQSTNRLVSEMLSEQRPAYVIQMSSGRWVIADKKNLDNKTRPVNVLDDTGTWLPMSSLVHSADWQGIAHSSKEKADAIVAKRLNESVLVEGRGYLDRKVDDWMEANRIHTLLGQRGVKALDDLSKVLGYDDLADFLGDNSGAVTAVFDFIREQNDQDWIASIDKALSKNTKDIEADE